MIWVFNGHTKTRKAAAKAMLNDPATSVMIVASKIVEPVAQVPVKIYAVIKTGSSKMTPRRLRSSRSSSGEASIG
jgi:hypothetical protein